MTDRETAKTPNVSQYVANLNTIPSPTDAEHNQDVSLDDDLALFTDTQFFDFDMGQFTDVTEPIEYDLVQEQQARRQHAAAKTGLDQSFDYTNGKLPDYSLFALFIILLLNYLEKSLASHLVGTGTRLVSLTSFQVKLI